MSQAQIRCRVDDRNEKMGYKIRQAEGRKVPYMAVAGDKEAQLKTLSLRKRHQGDLGAMPVSEVMEKILDEIKRRINH